MMEMVLVDGKGKGTLRQSCRATSGEEANLPPLRPPLDGDGYDGSGDDTDNEVRAQLPCVLEDASRGVNALL